MIPRPLRARRRAGPPPPTGPRDWRRAVALFRHYLGDRRVFVMALLMLIAEAVTSVVQPYPLAYLIDFLQGAETSLRDRGLLPTVLGSERLETVAALTIGLVLLAMINSAADSMAEIYFARGGRLLGYHLRVALYGHLKKLSLGFHDQRRTGDVLTRVTGDVTVLEEFVTKSASDLAGSLLVLVGSLAFLAFRSWQVAIIALLVVPVLGLVSNHYSKLIKAASRRQRAREGDLASGAQEMLTAIRVVQTYGKTSYDERRFADQSEASMRAALEAAGVEARFSWVIAVVEALAISAIVWTGLWLIDRSAITVGTLVLFILVTQNMFKPSRKIVKEWYTIGKVFASVERIADLLDRTPDVQDAPDAVAAPRFRGRVTFDNVSFAYRLDAADAVDDDGHRAALHGVSLDVEPGRVLAIVGPSGAGKSTIAQLVPRLYDPDHGAVRIDGTDVRAFTLDSLRAQISLVLQDTVLFHGTVAENIAYGLGEVDQREIERAARLANAHEFIVNLPDGYDTVLGERAANLSGGQRQRIAIARAFLRRPPILILDEPTNGLDATSTRLVLEALETLMRDTTTILITHDIRLVQHAHCICVLDDGRVVQRGRHGELLREPGRYAELHARLPAGMTTPVQARREPDPVP